MKGLINIFCIFALLSCQAGLTEGEDVVRPTTEVSFTLAIPESSDAGAGTRAIPDGSQEISEIDVLVYNGTTSTFIERVQVPAANISGSGAFKSFKFSYPAVAQPRIMHIVVNGRTLIDNFSLLTVGSAENVIQQLKFGVPSLTQGYASSMAVPMWGRVSVSSITAPTTVTTPIPILRCVAAVKMEVSSAIASDFTITSYTLYNAPQSGLLVPSAYTSVAIQPATPNPATFVSSVYGTATTVASTLTGVWAAPTSHLYINEVAAGALYYNTSPTLLLKGKYRGIERFYAIPLVNGTTSTATSMAIVRNNTYTVTVTSATGGFETVAEAMSAPSTIYYDITCSNDNVLYVVSDGFNWFGTNMPEIKIAANSTSSVEVALSAFKLYSLGIATSDFKVVESPTGAGITSYSYTSVGGFKIAYTTSTVGASTELSVWAKNLRLPIKITRN